MRLIDADEYIKKLRDRIGIEPTWNLSGLRIAIFELHNMPTIDAVEVVRCKDCTHYDNGCALLFPADGYCYDGERRGEDDSD